MSLLAIAKAVEGSPFGTYLRESQYWFPALNLVHVLGLLVAAGTVVFWDLRLLGIGLKRVPVSQLYRNLLPWTWAGFAAMLVTGSLLVTLEAGRLYENTFFRLKVLALLLAGLNALTFHFSVFRSVTGWETDRVTPLRARVAGGASLFLWLMILACGRAIGYTLNYGA
jgi:hypothetical protein